MKLPPVLRLKKWHKEILLYDPKEVEVDGEKYVMAQGIYFATKKKGLKEGETFQVGRDKFTSVVKIPPSKNPKNDLMCLGFPGFENPDGILPAFKIN